MFLKEKKPKIKVDFWLVYQDRAVHKTFYFYEYIDYDLWFEKERNTIRSTVSKDILVTILKHD